MFKVGDKVWVFNINRRVYEENQKFGGPIYAEHFEQTEITGETSRSWLIGKWQKLKVPKNNPIGIYTDEQKADNIWANSHRYKIRSLIDRCSVEQLRQIASILEYKDK